MRTATRTFVIGLSVAGTLLAGASSALAGGATVLADRMLDKVSAGAAAVFSLADAQATGVLALTGTTGNSFVTSSGPIYAGQPGLQETLGVAEGASVALGTNFAQPNQPLPSSSSGVVTDGVAVGNYVYKNTINVTMAGAGGVTATAGWTVVYGGWHGL